MILFVLFCFVSLTRAKTLFPKKSSSSIQFNNKFYYISDSKFCEFKERKKKNLERKAQNKLVEKQK